MFKTEECSAIIYGSVCFNTDTTFITVETFKRWLWFNVKRVNISHYKRVEITWFHLDKIEKLVEEPLASKLTDLLYTTYQINDI